MGLAGFRSAENGSACAPGKAMATVTTTNTATIRKIPCIAFMFR
jgi:hypothetical protein